MILVIGGRAQGKLAFAKKELGVTDFSDGTLGDKACLYNLQEAVREGAGKTALDAYLARHPDAVILCDEVGCGIVPMEKRSAFGGRTSAGFAAILRKGRSACTAYSAESGRESNDADFDPARNDCRKS